MDDFNVNPGTKALNWIYANAVHWLEQGPQRSAVKQLYRELSAWDLIMMDYLDDAYNTEKSQIIQKYEEYKGNDDRRMEFSMLKDWFSLLNTVMNDNSLLFNFSQNYQERGKDNE